MKTNSARLFTTLSFCLPFLMVIGAIVMIVSDMVTTSLYAQYNPVLETISQLMLYPYGWIIKIGLSTVTIMHMLLSLIILSSPASRYNRLLRIAATLFALVALGFLTIMVFKTNPGKEIITPAGGIHVVMAFAVAGLFPAACVLLTISLWHRHKSRILTISSAILFAVSIFVLWQVVPQNDSAHLGAYERLLALLTLSWLVMAGFRLPKLLGDP